MACTPHNALVLVKGSASSPSSVNVSCAPGRPHRGGGVAAASQGESCTKRLWAAIPVAQTCTCQMSQDGGRGILPRTRSSQHGIHSRELEEEGVTGWNLVRHGVARDTGQTASSVVSPLDHKSKTPHGSCQADPQHRGQAQGYYPGRPCNCGCVWWCHSCGKAGLVTFLCLVCNPYSVVSESVTCGSLGNNC